VTESLLLALGVALSPLPILAILLLLGGSRPRLTATAFWLAWVGGVASATIVCVLAVDWSDVTDSEPVWLAVSELLVGIAFVVLAGRIALGGADAVGGGPSAWLAALDRSGPRQAVGLALLLSCANPKNLALILGAAVQLVDATGPTGELTLGAGAFVAVAAAGVSIPFAVYSLFPERLGTPLARLRRALVRRGRVLAILLGVGIGALFVIEGVRAL
jgi:Sap, sulfolipid-1-addressing protein